MRSFAPARFRASSRASVRAAALATVAGSVLTALVAACADTDRSSLATENAAESRAGAAGTHVQYGTPIQLGQGRARTYVVLDRKAGGAPLEVGVALDERALDGLPTHGTGDGPHGNFVAYDLPMPAQHATPYRFVELDWNPAGHGHPHGDAHFDFHFYTVTPEERNAIDPSDPQFQAKANNAPGAAYVPQPFLMYPAPPNAMAVPRMGVHWIDPRSPELQELLGNPAGYKPFTTTFIMGSWDGKFIFAEPMITRAYIVGKKSATDAAVQDEVIALPTAQRYAAPGYYPSAYRIAWNAQAKEYRIALTQLMRRD
jgi:hypothetical protein